MFFELLFLVGWRVDRITVFELLVLVSYVDIYKYIYIYIEFTTLTTLAAYSSACYPGLKSNYPSRIRPSRWSCRAR